MMEGHLPNLGRHSILSIHKVLGQLATPLRMSFE